MKTLNVILLLVGVFLFCFILAMTIIFCVKGSIPDTLVVSVLGAGGGELALSALITIAKKKYGGKDNEDE